MELVEEITGIYAFTMLIGSALSAVLAIGLLWLYRRVLIKLMQAQPGLLPRSWRITPSAAAPPIHSGPPLEAEQLFSEMNVARLRLAAVYAGAGLVTVLLLAVQSLMGAQIELSPGRLLVTLLAYAWPVVLTTSLVAAINTRERRTLFSGYAASVLAVAAILNLGGVSRLQDPIVAVLMFNAVPSLLAWAALNRHVRAVGPLVLLMVALTVLGANLSILLLKRIIELGALSSLSMNAYLFISLWLSAGCVAFSAFAALLLWGLRRLYAQKLLSEQQLTLGSLWLTFIATHSVMATFDGGAQALPKMLLSGWALLICAWGLLHLLPRRRHASRLLFLRIFSEDKHSDSLWQLLNATFRHVGSIRLIAGPDLVDASVQPHEFLDFAVGKLRSRFVADAPGLRRAREALDDAPDGDGRYRANSLFCYADTWRSAFLDLTTDSDVVLMDLRHSIRDREGALYELREVAVRVPPERLVMVVGDQTERALIAQQIEAARKQAGLSLAYRFHVVPWRAGSPAAPLCAALANAAAGRQPQTDAPEDAAHRVWKRAVAGLVVLVTLAALAIVSRPAPQAAPAPPAPDPPARPHESAPRHAAAPVEPSPAPNGRGPLARPGETDPGRATAPAEPSIRAQALLDAPPRNAPHRRAQRQPRAVAGQRTIWLNGELLGPAELAELDQINCGERVPDGAYLFDPVTQLWTQAGAAEWYPLPDCNAPTGAEAAGQPEAPDPAEPGVKCEVVGWGASASVSCLPQ